MSRRRQRRVIEVFNLSFLDVVSCGFGAIILLLVIVKVAEPRVLEQLSVDLSGLVQRLEAELVDKFGEGEMVPLVRHRPAHLGEVVEQRLGQDPGLSIVVQTDRILAFRDLGSVRVAQQR